MPVANNKKGNWAKMGYKWMLLWQTNWNLVTHRTAVYCTNELFVIQITDCTLDL